MLLSRFGGCDRAFPLSPKHPKHLRGLTPPGARWIHFWCINTPFSTTAALPVLRLLARSAFGRSSFFFFSPSRYTLGLSRLSTTGATTGIGILLWTQCPHYQAASPALTHSPKSISGLGSSVSHSHRGCLWYASAMQARRDRVSGH